MKKKIIAVIFTLACTCVLIAGCGNDSSKKDTKKDSKQEKTTVESTVDYSTCTTEAALIADGWDSYLVKANGEKLAGFNVPEGLYPHKSTKNDSISLTESTEDDQLGKVYVTDSCSDDLKGYIDTGVNTSDFYTSFDKKDSIKTDVGTFTCFDVNYNMGEDFPCTDSYAYMRSGEDLIIVSASKLTNDKPSGYDLYALLPDMFKIK